MQCDQGTQKWKAFNCALTIAARHCLFKETADTKNDYLCKKIWIAFITGKGFMWKENIKRFSRKTGKLRKMTHTIRKNGKPLTI